MNLELDKFENVSFLLDIFILVVHIINIVVIT